MSYEIQQIVPLTSMSSWFLVLLEPGADLLSNPYSCILRFCLQYSNDSSRWNDTCRCSSQPYCMCRMRHHLFFASSNQGSNNAWSRFWRTPSLEVFQSMVPCLCCWYWRAAIVSGSCCFRARGWSSIITDNLLTLVLVIGGWCRLHSDVDDNPVAIFDDKFCSEVDANPTLPTSSTSCAGWRLQDY